MLRRSIFLLLPLLVATQAPAQKYIGFTPGVIGTKYAKWKRKLERYWPRQSVHTEISTTDSTIVLRYRDPKFKEADYTYHFDAKGRCDSETRSICDSCVNVYWQQTLANKQYKWTQVPGGYVTTTPRPLMLEMIPYNGQPAVRLRKAELVPVRQPVDKVD